MMPHRKSLLLAGVVLAAGLFAFTPKVATADIVVSPVPVVTGTGPYTWTYTFTLLTGQTMRAGAYVTIYDFYGWVPGSQFAPSALWNLTTNATSVAQGPNPINPPITPNENNTVINLSWLWLGPDIVGAGQSLGTFGADSTINDSQLGIYAEQSTLNGGAGTSSQGFTLTPNPEPTTMVLYGIGAIGLLGIWKRRK